MALKRKRSSPALSSPASDSSNVSSLSGPLPFFYAQSKPVEPLYIKPTWSFPTYDDRSAGQHLNSRTRKRHRDNRPHEEQVYASTLHKLFDAQRQHPNAAPIHSQQALASQAQPQRSTLHSFWRIGQAPSTTPMAIDSANGGVSYLSGLKCEDCDRQLRSDDAMDLDDDSLEQEKSCTFCKRQICDTCAVLWDKRKCLSCAATNG